MFKHLFVAAMVAFTASAVVQAQEASVVSSPAEVLGDLVYGSANAPIEIVEYGSLTCPHCGEFARDVFPEFKKAYVDTGKVRFVFRNFIRDRYDMAVASLSRCTSDPEVTKGLVETYFGRQKEWMTAENPYDVIGAIAKEAGIRQADMADCFTDDALQRHLVEMKISGASKYGISRVPFFLINGEPFDGHTLEAMEEAVAKVGH